MTNKHKFKPIDIDAFCGNIIPKQRKLIFNTETKEVFDELNNMIGYGELKDGVLAISNNKHDRTTKI